MCQQNNITKSKKGKHLEYNERQSIERWFNRDKRTKVEIAGLLDRTEKTIRNEIKRGLVKNLTTLLEEIWVYSADVAQQRYEYYLKAKEPKLKIDNDYELKEYVEKSKGEVDSIRGRMIEGTEQGANFERIDYNEDMVAWVDIDRYPHNAHTMIQETENGTKGVVINGSMLQMLSLDGKKPATSLELTRHIFEQTAVEERSKFAMNMPNRKVDSLVIEDLYEYVDIYYENRNNPMLLKAKLSDFQDRLIQKYASSKFFSKEKLSGTRMDLFIRDATKQKNFESR